MLTLGSDESRKLLDAMGVPVVVLRARDASAQSEGIESTGSPAISLGQREPIPTSPVAQTSPVAELLTQPPAQLPESHDVEIPITTSDADRSVDAKEIVASPEVRFTLVSAITADAMLVVELPDWASGLMDGRMTAICSDLLRVLSASPTESADWQYFHWPIDGITDQSKLAASEAVDAWLHRRWAEMQAPAPRVMTSIQSLDASELTADALLFSGITDLLSDPESKRALWEQLKTFHRGDA